MDTNRKGDIGEAKILSELISKGYDVYIPFSGHSRDDLIVNRNGNLERVQCKYVESNNIVIKINCYSGDRSKKNSIYTPDEIDWLIVYDKTTDKCYYIPSSKLNTGKLHIRLNPPKNNQKKFINDAQDFLNF